MFIVIMADIDEQQTIIDFSNKSTKEDACAEHLDARPYVHFAEAFTPDELINLAGECKAFYSKSIESDRKQR